MRDLDVWKASKRNGALDCCCLGHDLWFGILSDVGINGGKDRSGQPDGRFNDIIRFEVEFRHQNGGVVREPDVP